MSYWSDFGFVDSEQCQIDREIAYLDPDTYPIAGHFVRRYFWTPKFWPYMEQK